MLRHGVLVLGIVSIGCSGPSKAGLDARANAHERMDIVNADLAAQQAMQQFEVGQFDDALGTIENAIQRYPRHPDYHMLKGRVLLEKHQLDLAHQSFTQVLELEEDFPEAHYFLGILHQRWGEDEAALSCYTQAMECDDEHPQYVMATAETLSALGQHDEAIRVLEISAKNFQHHPAVAALTGHLYLQKGDDETGASYISDSILLGNNDAETFTTLIVAQFHAGHYADCLITIKQYETAFGDLSLLLTRTKAKCLVATGRVIEGRDLCLKISRETPNEAGAWVDLGYIAWEMGDYERLLTCGEAISKINMQLPEASLFAGISALHLGDVERAARELATAKSYNKSIDIEPLIAFGRDKYSKTRAETAIRQNMDSETAESGTEQQSDESSETREIVNVEQFTPLTP